MPSMTATSRPRRRFSAVVEVWEGDARDGPSEDLFDSPEVAFLLLCNQRDGLALRLCAGRTPDPVHVVNGHRGDVVVDHVCDAEHINPTGRHVRRNEHLVAAVPEPAERGFPLALASVTVNPRHGEPCLPDLPCDAVRAALRPYEHEDGQHVLPPEEPHEERSLQMLRNRICLVADCDGRVMRRGDGDADRIAEDAPGKSLDLGGHRRGEE